MRCCGARVSTPFCPNCGKKAAGVHPLDSLVAQCRKNSKASATRAENARSKEYEDAAHEKSAARWLKWAEQLEQLIDEQSIPSPEKSRD